MFVNSGSVTNLEKDLDQTKDPSAHHHHLVQVTSTKVGQSHHPGSESHPAGWMGEWGQASLFPDFHNPAYPDPG